MSKLMRIAFAVISSFMFLSVGFGYAVLTDDLEVKGSLAVEPPPIYIESAVWVDGNIQDLQAPTYSANAMGSKVNLTSSANSYAVVKIVVKNTTNVAYGYNRTFALSGEGTYDNTNITYSLYTDASCKTKMIRRTPVYPRSTTEGADGLTFYVKFSYASGYKPSSAETLNSFLLYEFLTPIDSIEEESVSQETINGVVEKMEDIVTNPTRDSETGKTSLEELIEMIKTPVTGSVRDKNNTNGDTYVGTVTGSGDEDTGFLENLFAGNLNMIIDGERVNVTVMIKLEDVTGDGVADLTLYSTTDKLTSSGRKPVYAQVFAGVRDSDGNVSYEKRGETYFGYASVNGYDGSTFGTGSFNTGSWSTNSMFSWLGQQIEDLV